MSVEDTKERSLRREEGEGGERERVTDTSSSRVVLSVERTGYTVKLHPYRSLSFRSYHRDSIIVATVTEVLKNDGQKKEKSEIKVQESLNVTREETELLIKSRNKEGNIKYAIFLPRSTSELSSLCFVRYMTVTIIVIRFDVSYFRLRFYFACL